MRVWDGEVSVNETKTADRKKKKRKRSAKFYDEKEGVNTFGSRAFSFWLLSKRSTESKEGSKSSYK